MSFRLLVEGSDDKYLLRNLLHEHGVSLDLKRELLDCGGVETLLRESLPLHLRGSYAAIGIVVDADLDVESRWQSIRNRLVREGYEIPEMLPPNGLIDVTRQPVVGVWVMPDNSFPGTLEDFARQLVDDNDELWPLAEQGVAAIPEPLRRFVPATARKAQIHTYLAWQEHPGTPLGLAITRKYFQTDGALALAFVDWIKRLKSQ